MYPRSRTAAATLTRLAALLAAIWPLACGPKATAPLLGESPSAPLRLVLLPGEVEQSSDFAARAETGVLQRFGAAELATWQTLRAAETVLWSSPKLGDRGLQAAGRLRLRLRPGGATQVAIVPYAVGTQLAREHRRLRRIELPLSRDAAPNTPVWLEIDLHESLHGNFGDADRSGRLQRLEISARGDALAVGENAPMLLEVTIARHRALASDAPAASVVAEHQGVLRNVWYAQAGAAVAFSIDVPRDKPSLRWLDASLSRCGRRIVEVERAGAVDVLFEAPATTAVAGAPWTPHSVSLAEYAGQRVRIRLRTEGSGIGLFGEPQLITADPSRAPDVLVYLIDTLRADHLGVGGSPVPNVSPTIDRLAEEGVWFEMALSSSPWTKPAIATLMSGLQPTTHKVGAQTYTDRMPTSVPLLAERFAQAGWRTGSFSASPLGSTLSALERGFGATFPPRFFRGRAQLDMNPAANQLSDTLLSWIDEEPDRPFFAYVHTLEVHEWKLPRYQRDLPAGYSAYDAAILDADRHFGALLSQLRQRRERDLVVVLLSDHGESWGDHGLPSHGFGLFQSQIHIPLIFWRSSGLGPRRIGRPVALADVGPTLLDGLGLDGLGLDGLGLEPDTDGRSLVELLRGQPLEERPVLSSLLRFVWAPNAPMQFSLTGADRLKVIEVQDADAQTFDLFADPREMRPLSPEPALPRLALTSVLAAQADAARRFTERHGAVAAGAVTQDDVERLRALGYLEASPDSR